MPILIPSKNIYDKSIQTVRNNVVNSVNVEAVDVERIVETDVNVRNYNFTNFESHTVENPEPNEVVKTTTKTIGAGGVTRTFAASAYVGYKDKAIFTRTIRVPITSNNTAVETLKLNSEGRPEIKYTLYGHAEVGDANAEWEFDGEEIIVGDINYDAPIEITKKGAVAFKQELTKSFTYTEGSNSVSTSASVKLVDNYTQTGEVSIEDDKYYKFQIAILCDLYRVEMGAGTSWTSLETVPKFKFTGQYVHVIAEEIAISVNGNVISLNLVDETVKYGNGDKIHTLVGNELMQTTAETEGILTTKYLAENTLNQYEKGKQTAELLCSISDYYEYDITKPHNRGNKHIDIETANMTFKIGDIVLPMVYNSKGIDEPLSLVGTSKGKVYEVLGTEIIYDGAVWQKLTLQEYGDVEYKPDADKLSAPIIQLSGSNKLSVIDASRKATILEFWVNGIKTAIMPYSKSIDLSLLGLKNNTQYEIYVIANAIGYLASEPSNTVTFININSLPQPRVELNGNTLMIYDDSGDAEEFDIYAENKLILTTMAGSSNEKGGITYNIVGKTYIVEDNEAGGKHYIIGDTV